MEENKESGIVISETTAVDPAKPITDAVNKVGIEMPDLVAEGDLTVDSKTSVDDTVVKPFNKKDVPLPIKGTVFMCDGHEYKVTYINEGQHRFSCEPHEGTY